MHCHLNCHGELNAIVAAVPVLAYLVARVREKLRVRRAR